MSIVKQEPHITVNNKKGNMQITLTSDVLRRAADLRDEISAKEAELNQLLAGQLTVEASPTRAATVTTTASGRKFSPAAIEKIRAAQRRRWKNVRKAAAQAQAAVAALQQPTVAPAAPAPAPAPAPVATPAPAATPAPKKGQLVPA